jgi:hypothetical protein
VLKLGKYDIHALVPILVLLGPALIAASSQVGHPSWAALLQVGGIVCVGLGGHALPQPQWAVGKPLVPAAAVGIVTPLVTVLYQLAQSQPAGVAQTLLYGACCGLSFAAGLHAPSALQAAPAVAKALIIALVGACALWGPSARAQVSEGPSGCLGLQQVHCGGAAGFLAYRPAAGAFDFAPAVGPSIDYHFARWMLGLALLNGGYQALQSNGASGWFGTLAPFAALGDSFGIAKGLAIAPEFDLYGSAGGAFKGWTWARNFRIGFSASPDFLNSFQLFGPK